MPTPIMNLTITADDYGMFEADDTSRPGSPPVGRGASICEAIGEYAMNNGLVDVTYKPEHIGSVGHKIGHDWRTLLSHRNALSGKLAEMSLALQRSCQSIKPCYRCMQDVVCPDNEMPICFGCLQKIEENSRK